MLWRSMWACGCAPCSKFPPKFEFFRPAKVTSEANLVGHFHYIVEKTQGARAGFDRSRGMGRSQARRGLDFEVTNSGRGQILQLAPVWTLR